MTQRDVFAEISFYRTQAKECKLKLTVDLGEIEKYILSTSDAVAELQIALGRLRRHVANAKIIPSGIPHDFNPDIKSILQIVQGLEGPLDTRVWPGQFAIFMFNNKKDGRELLLAAITTMESTITSMWERLL